MVIVDFVVGDCFEEGFDYFGFRNCSKVCGIVVDEVIENCNGMCLNYGIEVFFVFDSDFEVIEKIGFVGKVV